MFKKIIGSFVVFFAGTVVAVASGIGGEATGYVGTGGGYASSLTQGGSMAQGNVNGTGVSAQFTSNEGGAYSGAGAAIGSEGVVTYTAGGSYASNVSAGFTAGQAGGTTAGAVGSDFASEAWGNFDTGSIGFTAGFGGFGDCNGNSCGNHGWGDHSNGNGNGHNNGNH